MAKTTIDSLSIWSTTAAIKNETKKLADLVSPIVKDPAKVQETLGSDPVILIDESKKELSLSDILKDLKESDRKFVVTEYLNAAEEIEKIRGNLVEKLEKRVDKIKVVPPYSRYLIRPYVLPPVVKPFGVRPRPLIDPPKPYVDIDPPVIEIKPRPLTPKPRIPAQIHTSVIDQISIANEIVVHKERLAKLQAIQKALPAKATKAEKKAAATAIQQTKALISAAEKASKSSAKKVTKAVKSVAKKAKSKKK